MAEFFHEDTSAKADVLVRLAARQLDSVEQYAGALKEFSTHQIPAFEFVSKALGVALRQTGRNVEDAVSLSAQYVAWLYSLVGIRIDLPVVRRAEKTGGGRPASAKEK